MAASDQLLSAAKVGDIAAARQALDRGASINASDFGGDTALHYASR